MLEMIVLVLDLCLSLLKGDTSVVVPQYYLLHVIIFVYIRPYAILSPEQQLRALRLVYTACRL